MPKVLTVDDSRTLRLIVRGTLAKCGIDVVEAENGEDGVERARELEPDAILLDLTMPVMDGRECLARLREDPATSGIPVIILTATAAHETVVELMRMGIAGYIVKPFRADDLEAKLKRAFAMGSGKAEPAERPEPADEAGPAAAEAKPTAVSAFQDDPEEDARTTSLAARSPGDRPLVLAVDDRNDVLDLLETHLAGSVEFVRASGGLEAVSLIRTRTPDALLLDLDMPGATGADVFLETVEELKGHGSLVWGMSPASRVDDIARAKRAGIRKFLTKPFEDAELAGIVDSIRQQATS